MAEVPSTHLLNLQSPAPEFELPDASGELVTLDDVRGPRGLFVMFVCNHCPYVVHLADALAIFAKECDAANVGVVAINSNDPTRYAADAADKMPTFAQKHSWEFPYLVDADQTAAHAYHAACTPDFFLFDGELRLQYAGQFDNSRPGNGKPVDGADLRQALTAMLAGQPPCAPQRPSTGCSIKWKPGNELAAI
ncbi:MAG: thioredoxin family protein [Verrucomicrobiaceae bacterium]|nr:thioredoxin family protein [Verrucomicrobiaceae bacterium]